MPRRKDLKKIVILGSGPIIIGQACEFDYSGTQACKALLADGFEVILINSNPATIMTDKEIATRVYIEPLKLPFVKKILELEKPQAIIPTLGGQTALNLALELDENGILDSLNIELLGAKREVIRRAEDRDEFRRVLDAVGARYPKSEMVKSFEQGLALVETLGLPLILRPNYTLGGGGGGVAFTTEEYRTKLAIALSESPTSEVLVEESIAGWKEFELEVMRDRSGTFVIICSIENFDPCGVHTGDSITVAPQQTLSDKQYQDMRDEAQKIIEAVGVETGGANIQFAVHPTTGQRVVIEMNPRVSRSSALASKATGFPIAKIAALLAVGYQLDEITNDITKVTPCCFEPALDYVVTKVPKFAFEKFSGSKDQLSTQMKSVGEVMGIGRTFAESLGKALTSLEEDTKGFKSVQLDESLVGYPNSARIYHIFECFRQGWQLEQIQQKTQIDPWFLERIESLVNELNAFSTEQDLDSEGLLKLKRLGLSDALIAHQIGVSEGRVRDLRYQWSVLPGFFQVDTCAGEFVSHTPYFYSSYWAKREEFDQSLKRGKPLVALLGSGPNRIGQGVEFDYSCVRSIRQFQKSGYSVLMVNSNPETVSTDYDTSDLLFFEPLTTEYVLEILNYTQPDGFVAQLGGQTPLNIAPALVNAGYKLLGSSLETIELAEDRGRFSQLCREFGFEIPKSGMASNFKEAQLAGLEIGYPVICRPSYVLGGRRMEIIESEEELRSYFDRHGNLISADSPCLIDQFLETALEVDVDLVRGADWICIGGILEHIEAAGVHSGDSMGVLPPQRLKAALAKNVEDLSCKLADRLNIVGFLNLQLAIKEDRVFMLEANPRSSRSVPFIAKAVDLPLVDLGVRALLGEKKDLVRPENYNWKLKRAVAVKGVVFPFKKFPEADSLLGPEMKSTGESMGRGDDYAEALLKALFSSQSRLPLSGEVFLSLRDKDKERLLPVAQSLSEMGYSFSATGGTARYLREHGFDVLEVKKVHEGRPHCVDRIRSGDVSFVINTASAKRAIEASFSIRRSCIDFAIPCITEADAALAFVLALQKHRLGDFSIQSL